MNYCRSPEQAVFTHELVEYWNRCVLYSSIIPATDLTSAKRSDLLRKLLQLLPSIPCRGSWQVFNLTVGLLPPSTERE